MFTAEGNGPVNAIDTALRRAVQQGLSASRQHPSHRLQGAHPRRWRQATGCRDPGAAVGHRRRARLDHDRRQRQHHRSVVAGARGEHRLRPPPRARADAMRHADGAERLRWTATMAAPADQPPPVHRETHVLHVARRRPRPVVARSARRRRGAAARRARASGRRAPIRATRSRIANRLAPRSTCRIASVSTTRSAAASASRCGGRRCSAGRRSSTTSGSRSRSGASSTSSPPDDLLARRAAALRGRRQRQPSLRRGPQIADLVPERRCG